MTPLTKLQRYTAYCIMREEAERPANMQCNGCGKNHSSNQEGFCLMADILFSGVTIFDFPEIIKRKPEHTTGIGFWFIDGDWTERIKILDACISETEPR